MVWEDWGRSIRDANSFSSETRRVVRRGGYVITAGSAPGWLAGELTHLICPDDDAAELFNSLMTETLGFGYQDIFVTVDYETLREAVETYGFIYGRKAIDYLHTHNKYSIKWKHRIHYKRVEKPAG